MTDFKTGDKIRQIGYELVGTVIKTRKCPEQNCDEIYVTFEDEHGEHSCHATDLEHA